MFSISKIVMRIPYEGAGEDEMGAPITQWGEPEPVGVWFFAPGGSEEPMIAGHDRVVTSPALYGPLGSPFKPKDQCEIDGVPYDVIGHPADWDFADAGVQGSVTRLERVEG